MAIIRPFKGTYYNQDKVKMEKVMTQPYDKIDPKLYRTYIDRDPYNAVRLILKGENLATGTETNPYALQAQLLQQWIQEGIFVSDSEPAVYPYTQEFSVFGEKKKRQAFVALGMLQPYGEGEIYPHEETLSKPKADRLSHLKATETQFGLIFMLYEDPQNEVNNLLNAACAANKNLFDSTDLDFGVRHRVWSLSDMPVIQQVAHLMKNKKLLIADGHHRYETALAYRDEMRMHHTGEWGSYPFDYAMIAFVNLYDEGLVILPTHRLVRNVSDDVMMKLTELLKKDFKVERMSIPEEQRAEFIHQKMHQDNPNHHVMGLYYGANEFVLLHYLHNALPEDQLQIYHSPAWRGLDVAILHTMIIENVLGIRKEAVRAESNISYCREIDEALDSVDKGRAQLAFLLNPCKPETVRDIAFGHERMPQKSTDFYPKLMTGMILNRMMF